MITLTETDVINIKIPDIYELTDEKIAAIRLFNPAYSFIWEGGSNLILEAKGFALTDFRYHDIHIPEFNQRMFYSLCEINEENTVNFEFSTNKIHVRMSTFGIISAMTGLIIVSLGMWVQLAKCGRFYTEDGQYKLTDPDNPDEEIQRNPDVSFVSYTKASEEKQDEWVHSFITTHPTLSIEIVSARKSLKATLRKMYDVWMRVGTDLGLVICPFTKKIYIFEQGKTEYREQSIYEPFTHPLLPGYTGDFSGYVDKIE
jgi:Uma2 family endonuclease